MEVSKSFCPLGLLYDLRLSLGLSDESTALRQQIVSTSMFIAERYP